MKKINKKLTLRTLSIASLAEPAGANGSTDPLVCIVQTIVSELVSCTANSNKETCRCDGGGGSAW